MEHHYIGAEAHRSGILQPNELRSFLADALRMPLTEEAVKQSDVGSEMGLGSDNSDAMLTMSSGGPESEVGGVGGVGRRGSFSGTASRHSGSGSQTSSLARTGHHLKQQIWKNGGGERQRRKSEREGGGAGKAEGEGERGAPGRSVLELAGLA